MKNFAVEALLRSLTIVILLLIMIKIMTLAGAGLPGPNDDYDAFKNKKLQISFLFRGPGVLALLNVYSDDKNENVTITIITKLDNILPF